MNIGQVKKEAQGGYFGKINTIALNVEVAFVPNNSNNTAAPTLRIYARANKSVDWADVGALFRTVDSKGKIYLKGKIDDPSMKEPLYVACFDEVNPTTGEIIGLNIVWSRPQAAKVALDSRSPNLKLSGIPGYETSSMSGDDGLGSSSPINDEVTY